MSILLQGRSGPLSPEEKITPEGVMGMPPCDGGIFTNSESPHRSFPSGFKEKRLSRQREGRAGARTGNDEDLSGEVCVA